MSPRKKSKPNSPQAPAPDNDSTSTRPEAPADANTPNTAPTASDNPHNASPPPSVAEPSTLSAGTPASAPKGKKWLSGTGSWRSKAPPIVKTAKESVGVSGGATGELPDEESQRPRDDSPKRFLTKRNSSKGGAIPAAMTKVNVSSDGLVDEPPKPIANPEQPSKEADDDSTPTLENPPLPPEPLPQQTDASTNTWAWRSWWSRPDGYSEANKAKSEAQGSIESAQSIPLPGPTPSEEPDAKSKDLGNSTVTESTIGNDVGDVKEPLPGQEPEVQDAAATAAQPASKGSTGGSWFWSWSSAQNAKADTPPEAPPAAEESALPTVDEAPQALTEPIPETPASVAPEQPFDPPNTASTTTSEPPKTSAWAFWYRGKQADEKKEAEGGAQKHVGEVAVFNTPSQSHPEAAQFNEQADSKPDAPKEPQAQEPQAPKDEPVSKRSFRSLRGLPKSRSSLKDTPKDTPTATPSSSKVATPTKQSPILGPTKPDTAPAAQPAPKQALKVKQEPPNLIFPEFKATYRLVQHPNFWQQIRRYFLGGEPAAPHLHINPAPPRIKKAVAIGVHGFFPAPIIQKVLGQPTGTSIRFANAAAAAIKDWSAAQGYEPEIEQIALEGEGFIAERVNSLWKLLLNWIEHIKAADFILVACHSQGVPVAMMLVAKLIQFGCVGSARIGVCAMAGVNMGPFIEYKTKYFGPTAAELFEFSNPKSLVSQMYLAALDEVLRSGVRILYVGSIDDQLVSLEVRTSHPISAKFTNAFLVLNLLHAVPPIHLPRRLCGRAHSRPRLPDPPCRFRTQASQPRPTGPRPHSRTFTCIGRLPLRRRGTFPRLRRPSNIRARRPTCARDNFTPDTSTATSRHWREFPRHKHSDHRGEGGHERSLQVKSEGV